MPLGWDLIASVGEDLPQAIAIYTEHRACDAGVLLVIERGEYSVWVCSFRFWPYS